MSNYKNSKRKLDTIRTAYRSKGDVIFTTAMQCVLDWGTKNFTDAAFLKANLDSIDKRHDEADADGKYLVMTRDFEKAIIECASNIAEVNTYDIMVYIQREMYLNNGLMDGEPGYQRAIELVRECINWIENETSYRDVFRDVLYDIGFEDDELIHFDCGYLIEEEEE